MSRRAFRRLAAGALRLVVVAIALSGPLAGQAEVFSARDKNALALKEGGAVVAWGNNAYGNYGDGRVLQHPSPHRVSGLPLIQQVWSGSGAVIALDVSGRVWSWGDNSTLQLGERESGNNAVPSRMVHLADVVQISGGAGHVIALRSDGTVWVWGSISVLGVVQARPKRLEGISSVRSIASGDNHVLMLKQDGSVWGAGSNSSFQLGTGDGSSAVPVAVPGMTGVARIWAAGARSFALKADGALWSWGRANGEPAARLPAHLALPGRAIAIHGFSPDWATEVYIAMDDGKVYRFPRPATPVGILPRPPGTVNPAPSPPEMPSEVASLAGAGAVIPGANTGGGPPNDFVLALHAGGVLKTQGGNLQGQLGNGTFVDVPAPEFATPLISDVISASTLVRAVVALKRDGSVWMWGSNGRAQQADGVSPSPTTPYATTAVPDVVAVAAGGLMSAALRSNGQVWAWGVNLQGQLCDGTRTSRSVPAPVNSISGVQQIAAGEFSLAFLKSDGSVWVCGWLGGYTSSGRVGVPRVPQEYLTPVGISGLPQIVKIFASNLTLFALDASGRLWSFGSNAWGQFGDGGSTVGGYSLTPRPVSGITGSVVHVDGAEHILAVTSDGSVWSWGRNDSNQLGRSTGTATTSATPQQVAGVAQARKVAAGLRHSLVLRQDGSLMAWGSNAYGQLGDGTNTDHAPATITDLGGFDDVAATESASFARRADGTVFAWGRNAQSIDAETLGDGTYVNRKLPSIVLREGGTGRIDTNDWFLDLKPSVGKSIPAAKVPRVLAVADGNAEGSVSVSARVTYKQADIGKSVGIYVIGRVPAAFLEQVPTAPGAIAFQAPSNKTDNFILVQQTPQGWAVITGSLTALVQGIASASNAAQSILNGVSAATIPGARFCIGYAEGGSALLENVAFRDVLEVPGAVASSSQAGACIFTGTYLTGPAHSTFGSITTFAASVVGIAPAGNVTLRDGAVVLGTQAIGGTSQAVRSRAFSVSGLSTGTHSLVASYAGDGVNPASASDALVHTVAGRVSTSTTLAGPASSQLGASVSFVASVSGSATGMVRFMTGTLDLGTRALSSGSATLVTAALPAGTHTIAAAYEGDAGNAPSNSQLTHTVAAVTPLSLSLAVSSVAPGLGSPLTLTATASGGANSTGTVRFSGPAGDLGSAALVGNTASLTVSNLPLGTQLLQARLPASGANPAIASVPVSVDVGATVDPPRLANIATRMQVLTGDNVMIGGFIIGGSTPKTVVVRARGPSLTALGVPGVLANPVLNLYSGQTVIASNDDHGTAANAAQLQASGFAPANAQESAILVTLNPGPYTAIVRGAGGSTGVGLIEVFEVDAFTVPLINIATRGQVLTADNVMIGGFIIQGSGPQTVIVRARGPSLTALGVPGALANPVLNLYSGQTVIASNDNWQTAANAPELQSSGFAPADALESAILITLNPGAYTAIVSGAGGGTGVGIIEVFAR